MNIEMKGIVNGWKQYTLINGNGMKVRFLDFGGIITRILVPDRDDNMENIVLAYKDLNAYKENPDYFGALVGRVAGRIQKASFTLGENSYTLEKNDHDNHLHGGLQGFHQVIWDTKPFETTEHIGVELYHSSPDGSGGYPGTVDVSIIYSLNNDNQFKISYHAKTNKKTVLSLTNHSYFNLNGNLTKTIHNHHVTFNSDRFVELDKYLIPTGKLLPVAHTPFDFTNGRYLGDGIESSNEQNLLAHNGYDHYFIYNPHTNNKISIKNNANGRLMTITTDQPGMVMYTANMLNKDIFLEEGKSRPYLGVCFETQASSASLHNRGLASIVLEPNETYNQITTFSFETDKSNNR